MSGEREKTPSDGAGLTAHPQTGLDGLGRAVRQAVSGCHSADANLTRYSYETSVEVRSLIELLVSKGVVGLTELEARKRSVGEQVATERAAEWSGPYLYPVPPNQEAKDPLLLDCASRHAECGAACCHGLEVMLTADEVRRGDLLWDLERPYRLLRGEHGHCVYLDVDHLRCTIWERRPHACRQYGCASDSRIWKDFDKHVPADLAIEARARNTEARRARTAGALRDRGDE